MKKVLPLLISVSMLLLALPQPIMAVSTTGELRTFVPAIPAGTSEGIGISGGLFYVSSIDAAATDGSVYVYNQAGSLVNTYTIPGLPVVGQIVIDGDTLFTVSCSASFSGGAVVKIDLKTGAVNAGFAAIPTGCPNGLTMDNKGNLYVADFSGSIDKVTQGGVVTLNWATGGLLAPMTLNGFTIGPNDITYNKHQNALYTTNTGQNTVVKIQINGDGSAGPISVFSTAVPGGDGVLFDKANLIVDSPFGNAIYLVAPDGSASPLVLDSTVTSLASPTSDALLGDDLYITGAGAGFSPPGNVEVVTLSSPPLTFADLRPGANLQHADLRGLDLQGIDLAGANLQHADLTGSTLSGANLAGANLQHADLSGAILTGTVAASTNFNGANMQHVNLAGAVCGTPNYITASGANLQKAQSVPADCIPPL